MSGIVSDIELVAMEMSDIELVVTDIEMEVLGTVSETVTEWTQFELVMMLGIVS